jgi:hypothetical protein
MTAIRSRTLLKRLSIDSSGEEILVKLDGNGLPDWVLRAYDDDNFYITIEEPAAVWVPIPIHGLWAIVRTSPSDLLLYDENNRRILVLSETEWADWT